MYWHTRRLGLWRLEVEQALELEARPMERVERVLAAQLVEVLAHAVRLERDPLALELLVEHRAPLDRLGHYWLTARCYCFLILQIQLLLLHLSQHVS